MLRYYVDNNQGYSKDITDIEIFKEYFISKEDITEHLRAQLVYRDNGHPKHKIQPIMVGVYDNVFVELVDCLCKIFVGFSKNFFLNRNKITISIDFGGKNISVIDITNTDKIKND